MSRVLGVDPGSQCGWALLDNGARVASGTWDLSVRRGESHGMRYVRLDNQLREALQAVDLVAYEEVARHAGTHAAHVYGGIIAHLMAACERAGVPYIGVPVGVVKKRATGKGNASKEAMVAAAVAHWIWPRQAVLTSCPTEDEADALWIALCGTETLAGRCA